MKKRIIFGLVLCAILAVMGIYPVKDIKAADSYDSYTKDQIQSHISKGEAPKQEGKVFAGWYNGDTPVRNLEEVTDSTLPKFVDEDVLTVKFQLLKDTTTTSAKTNIRFLTSVDSLKYKNVQFKVHLEQTVTARVTKVYTSVTADGETFTPKQAFSEDSKYIATVLVKDFEKESTADNEYGYFGRTITVTPMWTTLDGTIVEGTTRTMEVNDGLYDTEVNFGSTRTWHDLKEGIQAVNASTEDVTIDLLRDVTYKSQIGINVAQNPNGTVTINGNGHTLTGDFKDVTDEHFIKFANRFGTVVFNNITIDHKNTAKNLIAFGNSTPIALAETMVVNFKDVTINSESTNEYSIINAIQVTNFDIVLDNVKLNWKTESSANNARAAIRYGDVGQDKTVNLVIKNESILNMSEAVGSGIVYATTGFNADTAIAVLDSEIIPYAGQYAYKGNSGDFQAVAYTAGRAYMDLDTAVSVASASEEDVTLTLLKDVEIASDLTIKNTNGKMIVFDGNGHTATVTRPIFIYQDKGLAEVKNLNVYQKGGNPLFRIGNKDATYSEKVTVNLTDITVDSDGTCTSGLIQAGYATMSLDVNMTNVIIDWDNTINSITTGAIVAGKSDKTTTLNLTMTECNIDASGSQDAAGIYTQSTVKGNLILKNTSITSYTGKDAVVDQNMKFARNTASVLSTYPAKQVQVGDFVYNEFTEGVEDANASEEDVTIKLLCDVDIASDHLTIQNENNKNIVWDGNGFTANISKAIFIYQKAGSVDVKNMNIKQSAGNPLFRIGELDGTYPTSTEEVFTVNLTKLDIDAEGPCTAGLIQAGYGTMKVAVNMKNVDFAWETTNTSAKNIIVAGADNKTTELDLNIEECTFNTANVSATKAIHAKDGVTGTITFKNSTVKTKEADVIQLGNMDLAIDTATTFWQGETQSIALVDGVQKSDFYAAVTLVNSATANTRMDIVNNFIHDNTSGVTINNANGNDVLVDGHGHTADVKRAILIYQKSGLMDIRNLVVVQSGGNPLFRIGKLDETYPTSAEEVFTVNLTNLDIDSEGTAGALIQAGYGTMKVAVNMKKVDFAWKTTNTSAKNVIVAGADNKTTELDLNIEDCKFDTTNVSATKVIHAKDGVTGTITFKNSTVKTKEADVILKANMDLVIDTATTFWQGETQSAAFIDGVQYTQLADAVVAANQSEEDVTIIFVSDEVTFADTNIDINNTHGKNITIDGRNKTLCPDNAAIRIYQKSGLVEVKNMVVPNLEKNLLFRIGDRGATYSSTDKLTVNLKNLEVASTSTQEKGLIQAGYGPMTLDLNMTDVNLTWAPTGTHAKGAITVGCADISATATVNLTMTDCTINTSGASKGHALYVENNATGTIQLNNTSLIAADGQTVYNNNIPVYDTDKVTTVLFEDSKFYEVRIEGADATDLTTYATSLEGQGYTKHSEKNIGNAKYAVYTNDEMALYINQFDSAMRIKSDDKETAFLPTAEQSNFTKVCDTKGYMVGVTADTTDTITIENGMCFIYLLADGTFLVYDGGRNEDDANHLYALLQSIAAKNDIQNIVISNWIVTHAHGDHMGCMETFFSAYASAVTIERVMLNKSHVSLGAGVSESMEKNVVKTVNTYSADTEIVRLHSGQEFYLADVKVEVLYTVEDLALGTLTDYNAASTITRLTIGGKTVLMTGDASPVAWELMCDTYGTALKCDYLQVPHHGAHDGGTTAAYDLIKPTYLLWPCGDSLYKMNLTIWNKDYATNEYLLTLVDSKNSYIAGVYDATNNTERITEFPFSN